ncbi:YveK family protein [Bacillus changyiensis]|uniref:YveK family protein n=1 Tax=Bacillus changyiensis TaxID=3004103 RepID=UPI0022E88BFE|nr:Wzz/FepE/Etk N-terminal domain-containing protein [Bacillus changyiensis]MDA1476629.1 Wzz/FepE/Etk N-terminal domain-containing protein [Bacillus changyiensis]
MQEQIGGKDVFLVLKKRFILIMLMTITALTASTAVNYLLLTPIYQASVQILINGRQSTNINQLQTNLQLINTYKVMIKSPVILNKVQEELNLQETAEELEKKVTVDNEKESQFISFSVKDKDYAKAMNIANTIATVFQKDVKKIMSGSNEIQIVAKALPHHSPEPVSPHKIFNISIFTALVLLASTGLAFLLELFKNTLKSEKDIENTLKLPVLGSVIYTKPKKGQAVRSNHKANEDCIVHE